MSGLEQPCLRGALLGLEIGTSQGTLPVGAGRFGSTPQIVLSGAFLALGAPDCNGWPRDGLGDNGASLNSAMSGPTVRGMAGAGSIGQPDAGQASGGQFAAVGGFWGIIAAVQTPGAPLLTITRTVTNTTLATQTGAA